MPNVYDQEGNLHVVDSPEQAQAAVASGQFAFAPGKVQLQDAKGQLYEVDASQAHEALNSGLQLASPEAVRKQDVQDQYGDLGGQAAAFGFHAADALGMNAATEALIQSKAKLQGVDPDVIRQEVMGLREANPIASGAGTVTGYALPALFSGGAAPAADAGALTKGLYGVGRALTAPGRAIGALGEGVGGLVGDVLGKEGSGFLSKLATRSATMGAQGATEMGAMGGLATIGESSLGDDHELTAEKFWSGVGGGALAGLIGGAGLGAASAVGGSLWGAGKDALASVRGRNREVEALAAREFGESADGLGAAYSKASAALSGKDADVIREMTALTPEGRAARRSAVFEGEATKDAAKRELRAHIDEMQKATENLTPEWREAKAGNVAKTIEREADGAIGGPAFAKQSELAQNQVGKIRESLNAMAADPAAYGDKATLNKLERHLTVAEREIGAAVQEGNGGEAFVALDNLKRKLGPLAKPGRNLTTAADQEASREVRNIYDGLRDSLTDSAWGKAGEMQASVNGAYEKWMGTKQLFDDRFMTQTGKEGWGKTFGADPAKIDGYVNGLMSPKNDLTHSIIEQHIASTKNLAAELAKAGELTPEKAAELASVTKAAKGFEETVGKASKTIALANQLKSLETTDHSILTGSLGNPARVVRQLAAIERIAASVDSRLSGGIKVFVHGGAAPVAEAAEKATGTLTERFARESKAVREFASNPQLATDRITKTFSGVQAAAPSVASQLAFKATQAASTLAAMLPKGSTPGGLVQQFEKVRYSDADMQRWLRAKKVIESPVDSMLDGMAKGHLSPDDVRLVQQFSPKLYDQMKSKALAEIANVKSPPTYQRKITLGVLFGVPADQTLAPDFIQMMQGGYAAAAQQQPAPKPAATSSSGRAAVAKSSQTASEAVEGG